MTPLPGGGKPDCWSGAGGGRPTGGEREEKEEKEEKEGPRGASDGLRKKAGLDTDDRGGSSMVGLVWTYANA